MFAHCLQLCQLFQFDLAFCFALAAIPFRKSKRGETTNWFLKSKRYELKPWVCCFLAAHLWASCDLFHNLIFSPLTCISRGLLGWFTESQLGAYFLEFPDRLQCFHYVLSQSNLFLEKPILGVIWFVYWLPRTVITQHHDRHGTATEINCLTVLRFRSPLPRCRQSHSFWNPGLLLASSSLPAFSGINQLAVCNSKLSPVG